MVKLEISSCSVEGEKRVFLWQFYHGNWRFQRFLNSNIYLQNKKYQCLVQQITEYSKEIYLIHYSKNLSQSPGKNISSWSHDLVHSALENLPSQTEY